MHNLKLSKYYTQIVEKVKGNKKHYLQDFNPKIPTLLPAPHPPNWSPTASHPRPGVGGAGGQIRAELCSKCSHTLYF